jgi:hypothetical protein
MIALMGASCLRKSSIFSEISKIMTTKANKNIAKKKVPRNFLMMYLSIVLSILMLDSGYWMLDSGCWIQDTGCWILDNRNP